jgi:hypothetical protein
MVVKSRKNDACHTTWVPGHCHWHISPACPSSQWHVPSARQVPVSKSRIKNRYVKEARSRDLTSPAASITSCHITTQTAGAERDGEWGADDVLFVDSQQKMVPERRGGTQTSKCTNVISISIISIISIINSTHNPAVLTVYLKTNKPSLHLLNFTGSIRGCDGTPEDGESMGPNRFASGYPKPSSDEHIVRASPTVSNSCTTNSVSWPS